MLAIGHNELGNPIEIEEVNCPHCGSVHPIKYGTSRTRKYDGTWSAPEPCKLLGFYECGKSIYLASLAGRALPSIKDTQETGDE